jgi:hypothetical protein
VSEFTCKECAQEFYAAWEFGDRVTCPYCGAVWETDYDTDGDDDVYGPWPDRRVLDP